MYDSPERSSYKKTKLADNNQPSTLENLLEFIGTIKNSEIFLAGDFNARTGPLNFTPEEDDWENNTKQIECGIQRSSKDKTVNSRGRKFLDLISSCNISILNGCTLGDALGEFTCMRYNGSSVVDYMAASPWLRTTVQSFEVGELTKNISDHRPITCTLRLQTQLTEAQQLLDSYDDAPGKIKWDCTTSPIMFSRECTENKQILNELTNYFLLYKSDITM